MSTENGRSALLNVTEELKPGLKSVTTPLPNTVELTVKEREKKLESVTLILVQVCSTFLNSYRFIISISSSTNYSLFFEIFSMRFNSPDCRLKKYT